MGEGRPITCPTNRQEGSRFPYETPEGVEGGRRLSGPQVRGVLAIRTRIVALRVLSTGEGVLHAGLARPRSSTRVLSTRDICRVSKYVTEQGTFSRTLSELELICKLRYS